MRPSGLLQSPPQHAPSERPSAAKRAVESTPEAREEESLSSGTANKKPKVTSPPSMSEWLKIDTEDWSPAPQITPPFSDSNRASTTVTELPNKRTTTPVLAAVRVSGNAPKVGVVKEKSLKVVNDVVNPPVEVKDVLVDEKQLAVDPIELYASYGIDMYQEATTAARTGDVNKLEECLKTLNTAQVKNQLLLTATAYSMAKTVEVLLNYGADPNAKTSVKVLMECPLKPDQVVDASPLEVNSAIRVMEPGSRKVKKVNQLLLHAANAK